MIKSNLISGRCNLHSKLTKDTNSKQKYVVHCLLPKRNTKDMSVVIVSSHNNPVLTFSQQYNLNHCHCLIIYPYTTGTTHYCYLYMAFMTNHSAYHVSRMTQLEKQSGCCE